MYKELKKVKSKKSNNTVMSGHDIKEISQKKKHKLMQNVF